jgi:hypothetical protein
MRYDSRGRAGWQNGHVAKWDVGVQARRKAFLSDWYVHTPLGLEISKSFVEEIERRIAELTCPPPLASYRPTETASGVPFYLWTILAAVLIVVIV